MCDALTISSSAIGTAGLRVDLNKRCHDGQQHEHVHDILSVYVKQKILSPQRDFETWLRLG